MLRQALLLIIVAVLAAFCGSESRAAEIVIESTMFNDPKIEVTPEHLAFDPRLKELWLQALARPEADLKIEAAKAIAKAHSRGMPDLKDTAEQLTAALGESDLHPIAALAIARALIVLDARESAATLHQHAMSDGAEFAQLAEPALLKWKFEPVKKTWLDRLNSEHPPRRLLALAMRGLAEFNEQAAAPRLRELALDSSGPPTVRLEASRALGRIQSLGLVGDAGQLAGDKSPTKSFNRLVAASMLVGHKDDAAQALLLELAVDNEPTVAAVALGRLVELDPAAVVSVHEKVVGSPDANVRHQAVRALIAVPNVERIGLLAKLLDDSDRKVRSHVRDALYTFAADPQYKDLVIRLATETLASDRWRGQEQSSLLLGALDHEPAADRLVQLIDSEKPQVYVASAWALRQLAVRSTLPAMLDRAKKMTEFLLNSTMLTETNAPQRKINEQIRELFQAFGQMKYAEALPLIARYVPKGGVWEIQTRCAAIWAGGYILEGNPDERTVNALIERLSDVDSPNPEDDRVRRMSAISLGRMKAEKALTALRKFYDESGPVVGYACAWAIRKITGEDLPDPPAPTFVQRGWFLEPILE
ncbi:MAG: HEAT repeat domain-containing protein [Planctomycetaceae bacterium]